jgi:protein gp37
VSTTKIDYVDETWNPVIGCTGTCPYCYARRMARRFHLGRPDFSPVWVEKNFQRKFSKGTRRIFVNSMSDWADWEPEWIARVQLRMAVKSEHTFLVLSKRPWECTWNCRQTNAMLGYSVPTQKAYSDLLLRGPRHVTFLSIEPILESINLNSRWLPKWIIVGAETGNRRGKVLPRPEWLRTIFLFALAHSIPLFFKESLRPYWEGEYFPQEYPA